MSTRREHTRDDGAGTVIAILALITLPAALTLSTVRDAGTLVIESPDPSPYGYTVSLLLFIVPALALATALLRRPGYRLPVKCLGWTVGLLFIPASILDLLFANSFFLFPNRGANLGIFLPGWDWRLGDWRWNVPVEEYVFWLSGLTTVLLTYLWADAVWLRRYRRPPIRRDETSRIEPWQPAAIWPGLVLAAGGLICQRLIGESPAPVPGYFWYLLAVGFIPACVLHRPVAERINWQAFGFTTVILIAVCFFWEASLALPYGWWQYQHESMIGIYLGPYRNLPIEEPFLWFMTSFTTIIVYHNVALVIARGWAGVRGILGLGEAANARGRALLGDRIWAR